MTAQPTYTIEFTHRGATYRLEAMPTRGTFCTTHLEKAIHWHINGPNGRAYLGPEISDFGLTGQDWEQLIKHCRTIIDGEGK